MKFIGEYRDCGSMNYSQKDVVQLAIHYMKENLNKKIRLTDIAGEVKLSTSYFSNLCSKRRPDLRLCGI
ncbi:AraC family transcriptional regulator [Bacteroides salyersiae]|nr:AraC family transcriptional regulator [Bacteroides salyersiae]